MKPGKILKLNDLKARNTLSMLELLLQYDSRSRVELAREMKCDNTTITRAVRDLIARDLLISKGKTELLHGRPREQLSLNTNSREIVGIALDPNGITGVITDLRGEIKVREQAFFQTKRTRKLFLETLENITGRLVRHAGDKLAGVGVSTFGPSMESSSYLYGMANFPELNNLNLRLFFQEKFELIPEFSDTMICQMYYELFRHPENRNGSTLLVSAGSGIGMATACEGQIVFSRERHGGELGHNICEPDGLPCACGRRGCLETRCSTNALADEASKTFRETMNFQALTERYHACDSRALQVVENAIRFFSIALANQINNLAPDQLILRGELLKLGEPFLNSLTKSISALLFPFTAQNLKIVCRHPEEESEGTGAALLVTEKLIRNLDYFESACPYTKPSPPNGLQ